ncbi:hypothetical protein [Rahnella variigena]|uniref:hypothetical protein n=1 Tax=Rahnella variigena TaxID=574964 RepID=UPI00133007ED|nr:hypothetical protein [Rahnella variigena]
MSLAVFCLLSASSNLQFYIFALFNSTEPTLYGSAFNNKIIEFGKISEWVTRSFLIQNVINALVISFFITIPKKTKDIFFTSTISALIIISITDSICLALTNQWSLSLTSESLISNAVGSPFIGGFVVFLYKIIENIKSESTQSAKFETIASCLVLLTLSILTTALNYYVMCFFYRPTSINFTINAGNFPVGNYFKSDNESKGKPNFSFLGSEPVQLGKELLIIGKFEEITTSNEKNNTYDISIGAYQGCRGTEDAKKILKSKDLIIIKNVKTFKFTRPYTGFFLSIYNDDLGNSIKANDGIASGFRIAHSE